MQEEENDYPFGPNDDLAVLVERTFIRPGLISHEIPALVHAIPVELWYREDLQIYCAKCNALDNRAYGRGPDCVESLKSLLVFIYKEFIAKPSSHPHRHKVQPYFEEL